jgi:raffinose/stachyose/melibiose transport system permease protein
MTFATSGADVVELAPRAGTAGRGTRPRRAARRWLAWGYVAPAMALYGVLVLGPFGMSVQFSFFDWNGIGAATWAGLENYAEVFADPARLNALLNAFKLVFFYSVLSVALGLVAATLTRALRSRWSRAAQTILFLPQVVPLVGAGIAWSWLYASNGAINQALRAIGLGSVARPWLADFTWALPAIGLVGTWVLIGFCTMLFSAGMSKIDQALYDAASVDGAGAIRTFLAVTLPGVRNELAVAVTVTLIAALKSFDVVYVMTLGGPGRATMVPGVDVYQLTFNQARVGAGSAMGVVLMVLVLLVVIPVQRYVRGRS